MNKISRENLNEIRSEIGILGFHINQGIGIAVLHPILIPNFPGTEKVKLGLPDNTAFEIGITGLHSI